MDLSLGWLQSHKVQRLNVAEVAKLAKMIGEKTNIETNNK